MSIFIAPSTKIPDSKDIEAFERKIGARLPHEYDNFIKRFGDGDPEQNGYSANDAVTVTKFLSIFDGNKNKSILEIFGSINSMDETRMPNNFIPVAEDDSGNLILLDLTDGTVWFWDHELDGAEPENSEDKPYVKIAENFDQFLDRLVPEDDSDLPKAKFVVTKIDPEFAKKFGIKIKPD